MRFGIASEGAAADRSPYMARRSSKFDSFPTGEPAHRSTTPRRGDRTSGLDRGAGRRTAAQSYSRNATHDAYVRQRAKKSRRKKVVIGVVAAIVAVFVGVGVAAALFLGGINSKLQGGVTDELRNQLAVTEASEPFYVLLMGVDGSLERENSAEYGGDSFRSDSIILARIDPQQKKATLISIVRDTYVDMGENGYQKINAAHAIGGPAYAVEVVSEYAGVPISHYAEINFDGFKEAVNALGGIEVNVPMTIDDEMAGGYVAAGQQTLNGDQALILCRSRHAYDEYGGGDYYRAANQRLVIGAIAKKLLASDPATMANVVNSMAGYITTDMGVDQIVSVALQMQGMNTDTDIYSCINPTISAYENGLWVEYTNVEAWKAMMTRVDQGLSPTVNEADSANRGGVTDGSLDQEYIAQSALVDSGNDGNYSSGELTVAVRNGCGVSGLAASASSVLTNNGYDVIETGDADSYDYASTVIVYNDDSQAADARAIGEALGIGAAVKNDGSYVFDGNFLVILGSDYA